MDRRPRSSGVTCGRRAAVKRSDLAGPRPGGDVGPAVSAHLADELRPDLAQDRPPVEGIIPERRNYPLGIPGRAAAEELAQHGSRLRTPPPAVSVPAPQLLVQDP